MADTMMEGAAGAMARMKAAAEAVMIAIGDSGLLDAVTQIIEKIGGFLTRLSETNPTLMKMGLIAAAVAAAIGPLLVIAGLVVQSLGALAAVAGAVTLPMLLIPAAIAAVVAALLWLWNNNEGFREAVIAIWERVKAAFTTARDAIVAVFNFLTGRTNDFGAVLDIFGQKNAQVIAKVKLAFQRMKEFLSTVLANVGEAISAFVAWASEWWAKWGDDIMAFAQEAWDAIWSIIGSALDAIMAGIEVFTDVAEALWRTWGGMLKGIAVRIFDIVANVIENAWNTIKQVFRGGVNFVRGIFETFAGLFTGDWSRMWEGIKSIFVGAWQVLEGIVGGIFDTIIDVISGAISGVVSAIGTMIARITEPFTRFVGDMWDIGADIVRGLIDGITDWAGNAVDAVVDTVRSVKDAALGVLGISSPSKVFMAMGEETSRGMALGIKAQASSAVRAAEEMAKRAAGAGSVSIRPDVSTGGLSGSLIGQARGRGRERKADITVELDGRTIMRAIGKPLVDEIRLRGGVRTV